MTRKAPISQTQDVSKIPNHGKKCSQQYLDPPSAQVTMQPLWREPRIGETQSFNNFMCMIWKEYLYI